MTHPLIRPGKIVLLTGYPESGKTTEALKASAEVNNEGGAVFYVDACNQFDHQFAEHLGVPVTDKEAFGLMYASVIDQAVLVSKAAIKSGVDLLVLDMVNAMVEPGAETFSLVDQEDRADEVLRARAREREDFLEMSQEEVIEGDPEEGIDTEEEMDTVDVPESPEELALAETWQEHLEGIQEALRSSHTAVLALWGTSRKFLNTKGAYVPWSKAAEAVLDVESL